MNDIECTDADGSTIEWELLVDPTALDEVDKDFEVWMPDVNASDWEYLTLIDATVIDADDDFDSWKVDADSSWEYKILVLDCWKWDCDKLFEWKKDFKDFIEFFGVDCAEIKTNDVDITSVDNPEYSDWKDLRAALDDCQLTWYVLWRSINDPLIEPRESDCVWPLWCMENHAELDE